MAMVLLDDVIFTNYGQFDLVWAEHGGFDGDSDGFFRGQDNGLVGAGDPRGVYLHLARWSGGSRVRITLLESAPPLPPAEYEDVVEVSTTVLPGREARWQSWAGETGGTLACLEPGDYRLRVSAQGRDAGHSGEAADGVAVDEYIVEIWPAEPRPDEILRVGSEDARYFHGEWGGRR